MFEKVSRAAERAATGVSRRGFLSRIGKAAASVAGALAGVAVLTGEAQAARGGRYCGRLSIGNCVGVRVGAPCLNFVGGKCCGGRPIQIDEYGDYICNACCSKHES